MASCEMVHADLEGEIGRVVDAFATRAFRSGSTPDEVLTILEGIARSATENGSLPAHQPAGRFRQLFRQSMLTADRFVRLVVDAAGGEP